MGVAKERGPGKEGPTKVTWEKRNNDDNDDQLPAPKEARSTVKGRPN